MSLIVVAPLSAVPALPNEALCLCLCGALLLGACHHRPGTSDISTLLPLAKFNDWLSSRSIIFILETVAHFILKSEKLY